MTRLTPEVSFEGKKLVVMTPQLAGIAVKDLGDPVGSLAKVRDDVIASLDLLLTGV
jgi:toxin CcdB